jgi:hypothetical protein
VRHPITLEAFADWLERQPAERAYNYTDPYACPIAQYLQAQGVPAYGVTHNLWHDANCVSHEFDDRMREAAIGEWDRPRGERWTFGQAARRARELLNVQP